jgi:hypothetical protein
MSTNCVRLPDVAKYALLEVIADITGIEGHCLESVPG